MGTEAPTELTIAAERLRPERRLGRGASGIVWLCTDLASGDPIAIKVGASPTEGARLADEAERLVLADAAHVPALLDAGLLDVEGPEGRSRRPFLALQWIDGAPASAGSTGRESIAVLGIARDVALALADLHLAGVAHGDVKPENIVVRNASGGNGASAALVDLGLAGAAASRHVRGGTIRYLPSEIMEGDATGDGRARDLFALGLTLAELVSPKVAKAEAPLEAAMAQELPASIASIVVPLLSRSPSARPSADWVHRAACAALGEQPEDGPERRRARIRRAYLAAHRDVLRSIGSGRRVSVRVDGAPGEWLRTAALRLEKVAVLRESAREGERDVIDGLDPLGRAAWLQAVIAAPVAHWPLDEITSDAMMAERLLGWSEHADPRALTYAALVQDVSLEASREPRRDPIVLALALGRTRIDERTLEEAEAWALSGAAPEDAILATGRALRRIGAAGRARAVLARSKTAEGLLEAAEAARRSGDAAQAAEGVKAGRTLDASPRIRARLDALAARLRFDAGDPAGAEALLADKPISASECEVRALVQLQRGERGAALTTATRGLALAQDDVERARLEAVTGGVAHAAGDARAALDAFRRAADHATRAGAVLEEATYLTGVAASAFDSGRLGEALDAAGRSALLFEHLGRRGDAARAMLARAAVYACVGAAPLAREAASGAIARARSAGDARGRAFAHLTLADAIVRSTPLEAREHAERALALLGDDPNDRLRGLARLLDAGGAVDLGAGDEIASSPSVGVAARLEWWAARARSETTGPRSPSATRVVTALASLATVPAPVPTRGPAMAAGATLAAHLGDGDLARRLALPAAEAARALVEGAPAELRIAAESIAWASSVMGPGAGTSMSSAQLRDIEHLVRALGTRDRLSPLLDQILDALVLWSGVERGLLLLHAPGGRLVPRAARNLAREDLTGTQLALSHTLAERALATGEPVVAVDATGELSEVHESVHALKLRSVLAIPLIARGQALGVVYLDDRVRTGAFGPQERSWARLVAAIAAVAIADARDQLLLRRAARRARRAEKRLAEELARREAELDAAQVELARARGARTTRFDYSSIVGHSEAIHDMLKIVDRVATSEVPVLVTGESGSGKELVAHAIHDNGPRQKARFVTENCGAIPESLLESTLFGHVRGAFTGASRPRIGLFEVADGGTLFLDEVGEMSLGMQAKLLRVLEDGEVKPVGSERGKKVSVRIIAATHRDLGKMVEKGAFREDLYYRLDVIAVRVPALRDRSGDVDVLAKHFVQKHGKGQVRLSNAALAMLAAYEWPGNIRQLENEIRRAIVLADDFIDVAHLSADVRDPGRADPRRAAGLDLRRRVDALESELVRQALVRTSGNQTRAAELLGLSRFGLQKMIKRLGIDVAMVAERAGAEG